MRQTKSVKLRYHVLSEIINDRKFVTGVELGVKEGETFGYLLSKCPKLKLTGVDLYQTQPKNVVQDYLGWNQSRNEARAQDIVKKNSGRAKLLVMDSVQAASSFEDKSVDFIFIDADHSVEAVYKDISAWYPKIKNPKAGIFGHDYNWPSVRYVVDNMFADVFEYQDNVWQGVGFNSSWEPDKEHAERIDSETGNWQRNSRMLKGGNPLRRPIRLKLGPYGERAKP